jgi:hypothetical protein
MPRLTVNDRVQQPDPLPEHWAVLLKKLDESAAGRGHVVTAVRFDGVDQPTFREPAAGHLRLDTVASIEVDTADPAELLDQALAEGGRAATSLASAAGATAHAFRHESPAEANQRLALLGAGIRSLVALLAGFGAARGLNLDQVDWEGRPLSARVRDLIEQLEPVVEAQQAEDWLTVADVLEYEVQPALHAWRAIFEGLRTAPSPGSRP